MLLSTTNSKYARKDARCAYWGFLHKTMRKDVHSLTWDMEGLVCKGDANRSNTIQLSHEIYGVENYQHTLALLQLLAIPFSMSVTRDTSSVGFNMWSGHMYAPKLKAASQFAISAVISGYNMPLINLEISGFMS